MCGVAGIFSYHRVAGPVDRNDLRAIRDAMARRGPDGAGEWFSPDNKVALAHRRLSILDLTEAGAQPMVSDDGNVVVSFNGEIYNYRELRRELEAKGRVFRSNSDTEVLLHLYAESGMGMLSQLRGMFALILWDASARKLFVARDPYGIKPLYYSDDGWQFRAASQVKALKAGGKLSGAAEPAAIAGFYLFGSVPEPWTIYRGIYALEAGHYLEVDELGASDPVCWSDVAGRLTSLGAIAASADKEQALGDIRRAVRDSVRAHLLSDVPVGVFLSSGVDSGAIAGIASEDDRDLRALTLGFEEYEGKPADEVPLAALVSQHYGLTHAVHRAHRDGFLRRLPDILASMDQPSIDGINTWLISEAASEHGWKVALSGLGGDELLGGYPSFVDLPRWVRLFKVPSRIPLVGDAFYQSVKLGSALLKRARGREMDASPKVAGLLKYGGSYESAYLLRRGLFLPEELADVMGEEAAREGLERLKPLKSIRRQCHTGSGASSMSKVAALESSLYMRNQLLRDADWAGMAHSLEIRTPLVDTHLLDEVGPLLPMLETTEGKQSLAAAPMRPLPAEILNRPKTGFTVPLEQWLQQDARLDTWKKVPALRAPACPWARRWAYTVMNTHGLAA